MLSFEEKKAIFQSFKLKEKKISNGRVSFVYPKSIQKGQVLATQLNPNGNGYVLGKYMSDETIQKNGYDVDQRGWISIKVFSKDEIAQVITEAMKSMTGEDHMVEGIIEKKEILEQPSIPIVETELLEQSDSTAQEVENPEVADLSAKKSEISEKKLVTKSWEGIEPSSTYEVYLGSCFFTFMGLTLATMEYGLLVWKKAIRKYVGTGSSQIRRKA